SWADINGTRFDALGGGGLGFSLTSTSTSKIDAIGTFAGRAGLAADRWFVFAKAGISAVHEKHNVALVVQFPQVAPASNIAAGSEHATPRCSVSAPNMRSAAHGRCWPNTTTIISATGPCGSQARRTTRAS
ncbi:MAG: hypothetical protein PS018_15745, partial [bacterium]|nr:hypothetical protein [bacterium]